LYRAAGRFGDADRVLRDDSSDTGVAARAAAREAGGDPVGAARLNEQSGRHAEAAALYARAGEYAAAARSLTAAGGDDDPRVFDWLRRAGALDELAERCLAHNATDELRRLRGEQALSPELRARVAAAVDRVDGHRRAAFDARVQAWVAQARHEVDTRFAGIWALDLGTTTCSAAIYDTKAGRAVLCPWKGRDQFASTISFDREGNEVIGLAGEELLASWVVGQIRASKRSMGTGRRYRFRDRSYRSEQVASRFIAHGRRIVENYLAERVRERVGELARADLGEVRDEWLTDAERHNDLRLERPRALLTIPAYFLNNQKHATRDACRVAGVDLVRLIHEPTAACMSAARDRDLSGRIVVVDLGAGTLDVSLLDVSDGVYDVEQVLGDNHYGGRDFDEVIASALKKKLGTDVPASAGRRLDIAAEYLKVSLSAQQEAEYLLRNFADGEDVTLRLTRAELADILREPLETLRRTCQTFADELRGKPKHLVLVGGPMLSPLVQGVVQQVFGITRTVLPDPRTAVAVGAALQAAVLDGKLSEVLLLDVVPLPLGIRVLERERDTDRFSEVIARNARIPTQRKQIYSTTTDNQNAVDIEIFNGSLDEAARIGHFRLGDLPPAPAGTPQIEVSFAIDASCVLEVTAQDLGTGNSRSIRVTDTTLLSPEEISDMARRQERQTALEELRREIADLLDDDVPAGAEATLRQFRIRLAGHRSAAPPTDADSRRQLAEIVAGADDADRDVTQAVAPLRDLMLNARGFLKRDTGEQALTQGRHLVRELRDGHDLLRSRIARVERWNATLTRLAMAGSDPLRQFRHRHDTGEYAAALRSLAEVTEPLTDPADLERRLRCLAETGDADAYRKAFPPAPTDLPAHLAAITVRIDGQGLGFVVGDNLVATNRHWATGGDLTVDSVAVVGTHLPANSRIDLALLRTAAPVGNAVARLGHAKLVHIGDHVAASGADGVVDGLVDGFESFPEEGLRLIRTGLSVPRAGSGGPLVNDLGEVVGVLTGGAFAITVDALTDLIQSASSAG
jgi:molecular chaperone DnaK